MKAKTIGDTQGEVKTKALLDTLTYMLAEVEADAMDFPMNIITVGGNPMGNDLYKLGPRK